MKTYSFTYHPIEKLHDVIPKIIPGIEKIVTIHYDNSKGLISGVFTEKNNSNYSTNQLNIDSILPSLQRYMEEKNPFDWYNKSNLPFEIDVRDKSPMINIFSELQNIVLLIRVPDETDKLNDLVFLYLNENPSNFGVTNSINPLTTDNKSIIAFLMYNTINSLVSSMRTDKSALFKNNTRTRNVIEKAELLKQEMNRMKENYGLSLIKLCQQHLDKLSERNRIKYTFSNGVLDIIKSYKGELKDLETIIDETVGYIDSLYFNEPEPIELLEWHMQFEQIEKQITEVDKQLPQSDKYSKTLSLLNKLEKAALIAKSHDMKLTGTNVGRSCQIPITAPAISDALYNHKSKINQLLKLYPEKWETIRNDFRPLKNVIIKENS